MHIEITPYELSLRLQAGFGATHPIRGATGASPQRRRTVRPNGTPDWHLLLVFEGEYTLDMETDHPGTLTAQSAVLYPPHVRQDYILSPDHHVGRTFWAHFYPEASMLEVLDWPKKQAEWSILQWKGNETLDQQITDACRRCDGYLQSDYRRNRTLALLSLEEIFRLILQVNPTAQMDALDDRVAKTLSYVANHIKTPLTIELLAANVGLSPSRLSHIFVRHMHCGIMEYIGMLRIKMACGMLSNTQLPIKTVSEECGFSTPYYFSKKFRKIKNTSPSAYRKANPQQPIPNS